MKLHPTFSCVGLALVLASGAAWAASGKTSDDTAPATPGLSTPPSTDEAGTGGAHPTDPTGANGALDMRQVDKKSTGHEKRRHSTNDGTRQPAVPSTPAKP